MLAHRVAGVGHDAAVAVDDDGQDAADAGLATPPKVCAKLSDAGLDAGQLVVADDGERGDVGALRPKAARWRVEPAAGDGQRVAGCWPR